MPQISTGEELQALLTQYRRLMNEPDALALEVRRLADQPHVESDLALSLMLGMLLARVRALTEALVQLTPSQRH